VKASKLKQLAQTNEMEEMRERLAHAEAKSQQAQALLDQFRKKRGNFQEIVNQLVTAVKAADRWDRVKYDPGNRDKTPVSMVVKVSDWQIGEVINADETERFGEFNWEIAQRRVFYLADRLIESANMYRAAGFPLDELAIFSEADLVSGNIHYELEVTNEFPVTVATANAGLLLGELTSRLAAHFKTISLYEVSADNHGRLTRKNQAKQGATNNYAYLAHVIANQYLANHSNVNVTMFSGVKGVARVQGKGFLTGHGHHIMGMMGIPYYGMERDKAREAVKRMHSDAKFDYISIAHWHVPAIIGNSIFVNGSLTGTTEFDHMQGRHAGPSQTSFLVHPKHGYFGYTPWRLD